MNSSTPADITIAYLCGEDFEPKMCMIALEDFHQPLSWWPSASPPCSWPDSPSSIAAVAATPTEFHLTEAIYAAKLDTYNCEGYSGIDMLCMKPELPSEPLIRHAGCKRLWSQLPPFGFGSDMSVEERERLRKRQRGYEKKYRRNKRVEFKRLRREWMDLEATLYALRVQATQAYVPCRIGGNPLAARYQSLLQQEKSLLQDTITLRSMKAWYTISIIRHQEEKPKLTRLLDWELLSDAILGATAMRPYSPLPLTFTW